MLAKLNSRFFATAVSVAALTVGMSVAQPAQKASAQVSGEGSTAAAALYNGFGANYNATGSSTCSSGTVPDGYNFCATDIPFDPQPGFNRRAVASLRIEAPVNGGAVSGLDQDTVCRIFRGEVTNYSEIGGPDQPITVVYRTGGSFGSGTAFIITNNCGADGSEVPGAIGVGSTGAVVDTVANTPGAIGYAEQANLGGIPSALSSPFSGPTYALVGENDADTNAFIDNILGNPDQVRSLGYDSL